MSRSYRKPWITDGYKGSKNRRFYKNFANRIIRRSKEEIPDGKIYRKFIDRYSICDYIIWYNPKPHKYLFNGKEYITNPTPFWKVIRK
jgi:hypothetical protein